MTCPHYDSNNRTCGFKSEYYQISQETIDKHCTLDYPGCEIFIENAYQDLQKASPEVEGRVKKLEEASKTDPRFLRKVIDPRAH